MSGRVGYNKIVTNGIVLYLDAGNKKSYPGSGNTWTDLTANKNNGTLTNGPTFDSANGGSIVFDGTDDYVVTPYTTAMETSDFTYAAWIKYTASQVGGVISKRTDAPDYIQFSLFISGNSTATTSGANINPIDYNNGGRYFITNNTFNDGNWHYVVSTRSNSNNNVYVDNVLQSVTGNNDFFPDLNTTSNLFIGVGGNSNLPLAGTYFNGSIAVTQVYNKALSASEISQNYNAQKSRFGL
jgi:hypothetical protein